MNRKSWVAGLGGLLAVSLVAAPALAEKEAILDEELDRISAAGQPAAINNFAGEVAVVEFFPSNNVIGGIQGSAQSQLRALVLNNVVGENQVANGVNIAGGGTSGSQDNTITQSWGAVTDLDVETVQGASAGGGKRIGVFEGGFSNGPLQENEIQSSPCGFAFIGICKPEKGTPDRAVLLSKYGDQVIENFAGDVAVVEYEPFDVFVQELGGDSQTNLAALIVNNVVGKNQVANGVNIASAGLNVGATDPLGLTVDSKDLGAAGQSSTISQFRGAPAGWSTRQFVQ